VIQEIKDLYGTVLIVDENILSNKEKTKNLIDKIEKLKKEPFSKVFLKLPAKNINNLLKLNFAIKNYQVIKNIAMVQI
jgi:NAD-dependent DNA ligase